MINNHETIIYGGAFNPPTLAHQTIVETVLQAKPQADVWIMPSGTRWDKQLGIADQDRLAMLKLMRAEVSDPERVQICEMELKDETPTETYKSVARLAMEYPERNFRYVFGADAYANMSNWRNGTQMQEALPMLVIPRGPQVVTPRPNVEVLEIDIAGSSTEVRAHAAKGHEVGKFVCSGVAAFIKNRGLYAQPLVA